MAYLGCHLSSSGGYAAMCRTAASIGADTFQFFTRNPRGGRAKAFDAQDAAVLAGQLADGAPKKAEIAPPILGKYKSAPSSSSDSATTARIIRPSLK